MVTEFWQARGWQVTVMPTQAAGHAVELAQQAVAAGHRLVLAAGGDGTLGEVAHGLAGTETVLAPLPVGTANSFAKELRMPIVRWAQPQSLHQVLAVLAAGCVQRMDLGYKHHGDGNGRYWLLWSGVGADGYLVHALEPRAKWLKKLGALGYALQSLAVLPRFRGMQATIDIDGRQLSGDYLMVEVSNCRLYAGITMLSPTACLDDGLLEVWLFPGRGLRRMMRYLHAVMREKHGVDTAVTFMNGRRIAIHTQPQAGCHTDGDRAGHTPVVYEIRPGALRLLVPNTAPADLFQQPGEPLLP